jgi:hypothetical protein
VRAIDAHYALGQYAEAAEALAQAQASCPGFRDIPEFKVGLDADRAWARRAIGVHGDLGVRPADHALPCPVQAIAAAVSKAKSQVVEEDSGWSES